MKNSLYLCIRNQKQNDFNELKNISRIKKHYNMKRYLIYIKEKNTQIVIKTFECKDAETYFSVTANDMHNVLIKWCNKYHLNVNNFVITF